MDDNELLKRIKEKDKDAFVQFMHAHGETLYSRLLLRLGDRKLADKAFREAIIGFYKTLTADDGSDPIESLLFGYADRACEAILKNSLEAVISDTLADAEELAADPAEAGMPAENIAPVETAEAQPEEFPSPAPAAPTQPEAPELDEEEACDGEAASGGKGLFGLGIGVLSLGIVAAIWVILGLLMDMQLLPELDLGYAWFSANIAPWF